MEIKVGYLVAYDYELIKYSLPTVYKRADKIVLAIDSQRKTFAGQVYIIDPGFFEWLQAFDTAKKIVVYEDHFYQPGLNTSEIETRTRNMIAQFSGEGGWHFQVDVDEYFIDFEKLVAELEEKQEMFKGKKITLMAYLTSIFKITEDGYFIVANPEKFALATNHPVYDNHRYNFSNTQYTMNHLLIHQSWGRGEEDLQMKLKNWGHKHDFDTESYFRFWQSLSKDNFRYISNFHPLNPALWASLEHVKANSIDELLNLMKQKPNFFTRHQKPFESLRKWLPPVLYNRLVKN